MPCMHQTKGYASGQVCRRALCVSWSVPSKILSPHLGFYLYAIWHNKDPCSSAGGVNIPL